MSDALKSLGIDDLLSQLRTTPQHFVVKSTEPAPSTDLPAVSCEPIPEEDLGKYVISQTQTLVKETMSAFKDIKQMAVASNDPDTISALADLVKGISGSLDALNKIHIQNKKTQAAKEIAHINAEARRKQLEAPAQQTNVLAIGTREEILKILEKTNRQPSPIIDAEIIPEVSESPGSQ